MKNFFAGLVFVLVMLGASASTMFFGQNVTIAPGTGKTADQVSGLFAWYKFDTIAGSDSSAVTAYTDASGTGNDIAGTATLRTGAKLTLPPLTLP